MPLTEDMTVRCDFGDGSGKYAGDRCPASTLTGSAINANPAPPNAAGGAPVNLANANIYRTFPGYGGITQEENTTNGNYNGFQTGLRIQNKWGLSGELDYTYSHEIDISTYDLDNISNPWNLKYDKGSGALDRRQMLSANYVYKMPFFLKSGGMTHSLLGGWELAGTIIDETGLNSSASPQGPNLSINYDPVGLDANGAGYNNRPDVNGRVSYPKTRLNWFNTSVFSAPIPAWLGGPNQGFGSASKDVVVGPGRVNFTTSLYKSFALTEQAHFELRLESFNTFNHTEFNNFNASYGSSQFGQITSTWDPRNLELGGTFVF